MVGYYKISSNNSCGVCETGCKQCSSNSLCDECYPNY